MPCRHTDPAVGSAADLTGTVAIMSENTEIEVAVVGGGNMGAALLGGMVSSGRFPAASLAVVERIDDRRDQLVEMFPGVTVAAEIPRCAAAIIAVKPDGAAATAEACVAAGAQRIVSIAAGVRLTTLEAATGEGVAVVRAMPNTPALVGKGITAIAGGQAAGEADLAWAEEILASVGTVERLDEELLDAFTGVAGSGPAYVFAFAEALVAAAVAEGIPHDVADRVVTQLLLGSAVLLDREGDPTQLRINVTSPGGTTAAGLARFDAHDLQATVADAVAAATERSRELG